MIFFSGGECVAWGGGGGGLKAIICRVSPSKAAYLELHFELKKDNSRLKFQLRKAKSSKKFLSLESKDQNK